MSFWKGKKVFITGHTGFKGSWLSLFLQYLGADITGYSLSPPTNPNLFETASVGKDMRDIRGDIRDLHKLKKVLSSTEPDIVIHMAAQSLVIESYKNPVETYTVNVIGSVNLFEAIRYCESVRAVINVTSDKCYENKEWIWGYRETERFGGYDPYSNSKACSELVTAAYRNSYFNPEDYQAHGVSIASVRSGNIIGGGDWSKDRLIPDSIKAILKDKKILIRNPESIRPWQHVLDPLNGYLVLAEKLYEEGPAYAEGWNFGPNHEDSRSVEWLVKTFCSKWGESASYEKISPDKSRHEAGMLMLDCSKAKLQLGWQPRWCIEEALDKVVEWSKSYIEKENMKEICIRQIEVFLGNEI